jgi:hypothetical protein
MFVMLGTPMQFGLKIHIAVFLLPMQIWCRVLHVVKNYFMLSTYTWMLGEGSYLQLLLINTWRVKKWQVWTIVVSCWTLPLLSIAPYTYARLQDNEENIK